jgi:hypothetical protein
MSGKQYGKGGMNIKETASVGKEKRFGNNPDSGKTWAHRPNKQRRESR